jgi:hypothetical protein
MAYPDNTDRATRRPMSVNRDGEGWGFLPLLLGVLAVFVLGYLLFGPRHTDTTLTRTTDIPQSRNVTPVAPITPGTPPTNR